MKSMKIGEATLFQFHFAFACIEISVGNKKKKKLLLFNRIAQSMALRKWAYYVVHTTTIKWYWWGIRSDGHRFISILAVGASCDSFICTILCLCSSTCRHPFGCYVVQAPKCVYADKISVYMFCFMLHGFVCACAYVCVYAPCNCSHVWTMNTLLLLPVQCALSHRTFTALIASDKHKHICTRTHI